MDLLENPGDSFWWEVAEQCSYATFYHTPLWHRIASCIDSANTDVSVGAIFDDGTRSVVPLLQQTGTFTTQVVSTFAGCYGGPIAEGTVAGEEWHELCKHIMSRGRASFKFISNPLFEGEEAFFPESEVEEDYTHILELSRDYDQIVSNFSRGHRSSLKKGRRLGVTVRSTSEIEDFEAYFGAYQDSLERWGKDPADGYSWKLFEFIHGYLQDYPEQIRLWVAEVENSLASGAVIFYWNNHVSYWHGAAYKKYFDYRPNNVLHAAIIKDALASGFDYYDFNPSGGYEGVAQFKARFGADKRRIKKRKYNTTILQKLL